MSPELEILTSHHLPALTPDLLVQQSGEQWRILRISPTLARLAGVEAESARGRLLTGVFPQAVPSLGELAREAVDRDQPLSGIRLQLAAANRGPLLEVEVSPGGLASDYSGRLVSFSVRAASAQPVLSFHGLVGNSPAMREVFRKITLYAPSDATAIVTGETGSGKELVARALHDGGPRSGGPFIAVNCTAISQELLESELFGHEKGAFTGALRSHKGRFERAHRGTLFLDEIGDMPLQTQAKLLRVLETGSIERVGAETETRVDVRVVCATNVPLEQAVAAGRFRADLYHRLAVLRIHIPPLRQRAEDVPLLVEHFLAELNGRYGRRIERLTGEALALLESYLWPGNVRELRNVLERVYVETQAEVIGARAFAEWVRERQDFIPGDWNLAATENRPARALTPPYPLNSEQRLLTHAPSTRPADLDAEEIRRAWATAGGNLSAAARLLGVHRATLYRYLDKLGLSRDQLGARKS